MLDTVWKKGNPCTLLVGMLVGTTIMENSIKIPLKKLKIQLPYASAVPFLGVYPGKTLI